MPQTKTCSNDVVLAELRRRWHQNTSLAVRAGHDVVVQPSIATLLSLIQKTVGNSLTLDQLDLSELLTVIPAADPGMIAEIEEANPSTMVINGLIHEVHYALGYHPWVVLDPSFGKDDGWKEIPSSIALPSGQLVECELKELYLVRNGVIIGQTLYLRRSSPLALKHAIAIAINNYAWREWQSLHPARQRFDMQTGTLPDVEICLYGVDALSGKPLYGYRVLELEYYNYTLRETCNSYLDEEQARSAHERSVAWLCRNQDLLHELKQRNQTEKDISRVRTDLFALSKSAISKQLGVQIENHLRDEPPRTSSTARDWVNGGDELARNCRTYLEAEAEKIRTFEACRLLRLKKLELFFTVFPCTTNNLTEAQIERAEKIHDLVEWMVLSTKLDTNTLYKALNRERTRDYGAKDRQASLEKLLNRKLPELNWRRGGDIITIVDYFYKFCTELGEELQLE